MPFQMKVQPIDINALQSGDVHSRAAEPSKPVLKSRLRRLFDRQFTSVLKNNSSNAALTAEKANHNGFGSNSEGLEMEPSSVVLAKMVQNFIEEGSDKPNNKYGRNRCNCFNGNGNDSSDDEFDVFGSGFADSLNNNGSFTDATDIIKNLIPCVSGVEKSVLAEITKIVEKNNKNVKRKDELRKIVADDLISLGYNAAICKSKWEKTPSYPAGEYEYIDVIVEEGDRLLVDIEFRSEFEMAKPTSAYKAVTQSLPYIFVGNSDRMGQVVSVVAECAKMSLKKKGMHIPPWRKAEYMRAKWLCETYTRAADTKNHTVEDDEVGEFDLIFGEEYRNGVVPKKLIWQPPEVKPKQRAAGKVVAGLASLLKDKA